MNAHIDNRRTGRTTRMVLALPRHRSIVLVASAQEKRYIENLIRQWRTELRINHDVYVRVIQDERDTDWLRGLTDREIRVDHHLWEALHPRVADYLRVFMRAQFRANEPRPGLIEQPHWPRLDAGAR